MNTKTRLSTETARQGFRALLATLLTIAMVLTFIPGGFIAPQTARAMHSADTIDLSILTEGDSDTNWSYDEGTNTITLSGDVNIISTAPVTSAINGSVLTINNGARNVRWTAEYSGAPTGRLVTVSGNGSFEMESGGSIIRLSTGASAALGGRNITISGGTIENTEGPAVTVFLNLTMTDGTLKNSGAGNNATIVAQNATNINISGGAVVENTLESEGGGAIHASGTSNYSVNISGTAQVKSTGDNYSISVFGASNQITIEDTAQVINNGTGGVINAAYATDKVTLAGGTVKANTTGTAINVAGVEVTGAATISSKGTAISTSNIKMSDTAKLTIINNSAAAITKKVERTNTASTLMWKLTNATTADDLFTDAEIDVTVAAAETGTIERVTLPALGGMASITGTNAIGQTLSAGTTSITGGSGTFSYQWQAGGVNVGTNSAGYTIAAADAGKTITCVITRADATGSRTATFDSGNTVPYNITISNVDTGEDDEDVELSANTGRASDIITLSYVLGETDDGGDPTTTNTLSFTGGTGLVNLTAAGQNATQDYTVNASDAVDGVIAIVATFLHTNLTAQTLSFEDSHVDKDLGDSNFTNALTKSHPASTGTITYSSSTPGIATVDAAGEVTIVSAGTVTITAAITADTTYAAASASYTLTVTDPAVADNAAIAAAKDLVEDEAYEADQADVGSEEEAKAAVEAIIGELDLNGVVFVVNPVLFAAAQAESEFEAGDGVDGSYAFTVTLSKGVGTPADTKTLSLTINYTAAEEEIIGPQAPTDSKPTPDIKPTPAPFTPASFSTNLYLNALGREPDEAGYDYWMTGLLDGSLSAAQVVYGFVFSAEMNEKNLSNEEFIEYLYMAFFGREPDTGGYNYWLAALNSHGDRVLIFHGFAGSLEFELFCEAHGFVVYNTAAVNF
ncbi:MAG: DUF4214 domain-containing protein [Oscillospiraceae bacterium]|nr:DUF4214 domain-containing protein [Oscillospiraceae bacterium]